MKSIRWEARKAWGGAEIGDTRVRRKFLLLPKRLGDEWRWLGVESIVQEHSRWGTVDPTLGVITVRGWRDVAWAHE